MAFGDQFKVTPKHREQMKHAAQTYADMKAIHYISESSVLCPACVAEKLTLTASRRRGVVHGEGAYYVGGGSLSSNSRAPPEGSDTPLLPRFRWAMNELDSGTVW